MNRRRSAQLERPYATWNRVVAAANFSQLDSLGLFKEICEGNLMHREQAVAKVAERTTDELAERYVGSSIDYLERINVLERENEGFTFTSEGGTLLCFRNHIKNAISAMEPLAHFAEDVLDRDVIKDTKIIDEYIENGITDADVTVLLPIVMSVLRECKMRDEDISLCDKLMQLHGDDALFTGDIEFRIADGFTRRHFTFFLKVLERRGLIEQKDNLFRATPQGKKFFKEPSYAQLLTSYYPMYGNLQDLTLENLAYDPTQLDSDYYIGRLPRLNSSGSEGIASQRVVPYVEELLREGSPLAEYTKGKDIAFASFGGGAGTVPRRALISNNRVRRAMNLDLSKGALLQSAWLDHQARVQLGYVHGSMLDESAHKRIATWAQTDAFNPAVVLETGFIPHDIGPERTQDWLVLTRKFFPHSPIIVSETYRLTENDLRAYPDGIQTTFNDMHDKSGQTLMSKEEWERLFNESGYDQLVVDGQSVERDHAMAPNEHGQKVPTVGTRVFVPSNQ